MADTQIDILIDSNVDSIVDSKICSFKPVYIKGKWADVTDDDDF